MLAAGFSAIALARIFPSVLSLWCAPVMASLPGGHTLAAGHSIFKVLCLLTRFIISGKGALPVCLKRWKNA